MSRYLIFCVCLCSLYSLSTIAAPGYFRSPDLQGDTLVFTTEGDLWLADVQSGQTQRLTTHPAEEKKAAISPDGQWIAFSANYEGATEAYVIPRSGGVAKRLSYENAVALVQGWTPDGHVIFSTNSRLGVPGSWGLVSIDSNTLESQQLPLADAIEGVVDDAGEYVYFVRFGLQVSTDNVKLYRGGGQGKLWRYRLGSNQEAEPLAKEHLGSIRQPMIAQDRLYFISDASGIDNIWSLPLAGGQAQQVTDFKDFEVRSAKLSGQRIVMQQGADIKMMELADQSIETLNLHLVSDFPHLREHWEKQPLKYLTSANLTGQANQVVLTARGQVAVAGGQQLRLVEINTAQDSRTREAIMSHDGRWIYAINDSTGEHEIWRYATDGSEQAKQLTDDGEIFRWGLYLSPDGQWLAHDDKAGRLFLLNLNNGKNRLLLDDNIGLNAYRDVVWSHDSHFLAITRNHINDQRSRIQLYDINSDKSVMLTSDKYDSYAPAFGVDGDWLYFLSDRHFKATPGHPWGDRNTGSQFDQRTEVYAFALNDKARFPFQAANELIKVGENDKNENQKDKSKKKNIKIQWSGLTERLWQVPVSAGNYSKLLVNENYIYLQDNGSGSENNIQSLKLKFAAKPQAFTEQIMDFQLSLDGEKMMVLKAGKEIPELFIVPATDAFPKDGNAVQEATVVTQDWQLLLNPQKEWQQIFHDTWLMHRDSLFDTNMRGLDWSAMQLKYKPLLERVTDRYELNDVIGQMTGELNVLHSQVRGGDVPKDENSPQAATLGAQLVQGEGGVLIKTIYRHDSELPSLASPLALAGVNALDGDVITHVNGRATPTLATLSRQLRNQVSKQVLLELKRGKHTHKTIVKPIGTHDDNRLRYQHWVSEKRNQVIEQDTNIGYLHLYAMGSGDFANFTREFYAVYDKPALIIDVRRNRGGNVDSLILDKLIRRNWMYWQASRGQAYGNMQQSFGGHLVVLADQFTYSDGETFTAGIKALDLGTVIGKQTAGAGVWLSGRNRVSDNGIARVAEYPVYDVDGNWVVEGHGVTPDIEVDNLPYATYMGKDAQLETAIKLLQRKLKEDPIKPFKAKEFPPVNQPAMDVKRK